MASIGHHLARRAFDATQEHFSSPAGFQAINPADEPQGQDDERARAVAMWAIALIWVTGILYMAMMSAVSTAQPCVSSTSGLTTASRFPTHMATSLRPLL